MTNLANEEKKEKVIIAGVNLGENEDFDRGMKELEELAEACDMEVVMSVTQALDSPNKATYMGPGKVDYIAGLIKDLEIDIVIFDNSLGPAQLRNLSDKLECAVMDRSSLILEIFSRRAKTREARLQVEVASLQYMLPRLVGLHKALSRQGGGSGALSNKGSGEKQLELDRRYLEQRLDHLKAELTEVENQRKTQRAKRSNSGILRVALVGYTNAGKSSLLNALMKLCPEKKRTGEEKQVYVENMLFATLDTSVRRIEAEGFIPMLFSDTVGFVDKLPHHLVKAFGSTLEEAKEADVILHVVDDGDEFVNEHIEVTKKTLKELGAGDLPTILVRNKCDVSGKDYPKQKETSDGLEIFISAKESAGLDMLLSAIEALSDVEEKELIIPYNEGSKVNFFNEIGYVSKTDYEAEGTKLTVKARKVDLERGKIG